MNLHSRLGLAGSLFLIPALLLISTSLMSIEPPASLVHPVLVVGGLLLAIAVNAAITLRLRLQREGPFLAGTLLLRAHGTAMNLLTLAVAALLLLAVMTYVLLEQIASR